jgi:TonB-dependent starch-binding outer membrane protein SusC
MNKKPIVALLNSGIANKKNLLAMKLLVLCLALSVFHVSGSVYSQKTTFSFNHENVTVGEVLKKIENTSDYKFLYRTDLIDINRKVNLHADNSNVEELLDLIFPHQSASFRFFEDNLIAITRNTLPDQQQLTVKGRVTDASSGEPLPGASIVIQGTTIGTTSNIEGEYSLVVPEPEAVLVFSYVGYLARRIVVGEQRTIDVSLDPDYARLDEVIVVGYGTQRRSDLTGSVERISSQDFDKRAITNLVEAFAGTVPGFYSVQGTSAEGGGSMEIRGPTSLAADVSPLIVIDGVIYTGSIRDINPNDIESIDILKDASSAAIFGSRAASGVVVITTTKGQQAEPVINVSSKLGVVGLTNHMKPFGPEGYMNLKSDFFNTVRGHDMPPHYYTNPDELPDDISVQQWLNYDAAPADNPVDAWLIRLALSPMEMNNYHEGITKNWYDDITQTGIRQDYDASVSGGMENIRYYFSAGYTANEGVTLGDEYKIFRSRLNVDTDLGNF